MSNFADLNPEGYQKIMGRFSRQLARSFIDFTGSNAGEKILDVGCGTGSMTAALAQRGDHTSIVGVDVSEPMWHSPVRKTATLGLRSTLVMRHRCLIHPPFRPSGFPARTAIPVRSLSGRGRDAPGRAGGRDSCGLHVG
jgi:SAM-dependent methyltransferase